MTARLARWFAAADRWFDALGVGLGVFAAILIAFGAFSRWEALWPALYAFVKFERIRERAK